MRKTQQNATAQVIGADDMVAYLLEPVTAGERVTLQGAGAGKPVTARTSIPMFHKIALRPIRAGKIIWRGGWPIGRATVDIAVGEHVHTHNLVSSYTTTMQETT
jgi:altronate hydrolase